VSSEKLSIERAYYFCSSSSLIILSLVKVDFTILIAGTGDFLSSIIEFIGSSSILGFD